MDFMLHFCFVRATSLCYNVVTIKIATSAFDDYLLATTYGGSIVVGLHALHDQRQRLLLPNTYVDRY